MKWLLRTSCPSLEVESILVNLVRASVRGDMNMAAFSSGLCVTSLSFSHLTALWDAFLRRQKSMQSLVLDPLTSRLTVTIRVLPGDGLGPSGTVVSVVMHLICMGLDAQSDGLLFFKSEGRRQKTIDIIPS